MYFLWRLLRDRHDDRAFEVLQVGSDSAYFHRFLRLHDEDIRSFHPGYSGVEVDDLAFQVLRRDETVGVVVIRRDGDVARVQLDYVTPRFLDFAPVSSCGGATRNCATGASVG